MKKIITILATAGTISLCAQQSVLDDISAQTAETNATESAVAPVEANSEETVAAPVEANGEETVAALEKKPNEIREEGMDEIDLEDIDDSAEAAKKPTIKSNRKDIQFVDISCDEATLADILRQFRKTTSANIISDDSTNLQQRVSVNLVHVHWLKGLEAILNMKSFRLEDREGIYRVVEDRQKIPVFTRTFQLNHASCKELADLFNKSYGVKDAKGKVIEIATAFPAANTVVITANEKQLSECEAIIKAVDKAVPQIYIEARFMELSSDAMHQLGLQWDSLQKVGVSATDVKLSYNDNKGVNVNNAGDWSSEGHKKVFSGTLSATDFGIFLSAFEKASGKQIFSNPKVIVSNGKDAIIEKTIKYPNLTITSQRNNQSATTYTDYTAKLEQIQGDKADPKNDIKGGLFAGSCFFEWGITLSVRPRIAPDGIISVTITPSISDLNKDITEDGFYSVNGGSSAPDDIKGAAYGKYPIIEVKKIETEFSMMDGSTAVIGGLTRTEETDVDSGIPLLRKIPWIGQWLFGWKSRQKVQKEIIICVTLGIANPTKLDKDIGLPTNAVYGREYISGVRKEPGFRGDADTSLRINTTPIHERQVSSGEVIIRPSED